MTARGRWRRSSTTPPACSSGTATRPTPTTRCPTTSKLPPSIGSKGSLLLVDSHFDPLRRTGMAAEKDPTTLKNMQGRVQTSNAAFSFDKTYPLHRVLREAAASRSASTAPRSRAEGRLGRSPTPRPGTPASSCATAACSTVTSTPRWSSRPRATSRTAPGSSTPTAPRPPSCTALDMGGGHVLGSGNPGDEGKALGVKFKLSHPAPRQPRRAHPGDPAQEVNLRSPPHGPRRPPRRGPTIRTGPPDRMRGSVGELRSKAEHTEAIRTEAAGSAWWSTRARAVAAAATPR